MARKRKIKRPNSKTRKLKEIRLKNNLLKPNFKLYKPFKVSNESKEQLEVVIKGIIDRYKYKTGYIRIDRLFNYVLNDTMVGTDGDDFVRNLTTILLTYKAERK